MKAHIGDRIVVDGHHVGETPRQGEITDVAGTTFRRYRVRWDSGGESIYFPDSDCTVLHISDDGRIQVVAATDALATEVDRRLAEDTSRHDPSRQETRNRTDVAEVWFSEDSTHTEARVSLHMRDYQLTGFGRARRNPRDPDLPAVGEELAAARAMSDLAHQLLDLASFQLERIEGRPVQINL